MKGRRRNGSKRRFLLSFLLPLFLIIFAAVGYGVWHDDIQLRMSLLAGQKPSIFTDSGLINRPDNIVSLVVNESTWIIESTEPNPLPIQINIINNGATPIDEITATDVLPNDWGWQEQEVQVQFVQADAAVIEIDAAYFETVYDLSAHTLTVTIHDIKAAIGKYLEQNDKIKIVFNIEYALIGSTLPEEFADDLPQYANLVTTTAWIGDWASDLASASITFTSQIGA
ncbi:MAG: hypothetical protein GTO54_07100 [Nitrososphaeria archaeon]|nr:hypothetical protein [Nitrososphaeria archaeon]